MMRRKDSGNLTDLCDRVVVVSRRGDRTGERRSQHDSERACVRARMCAPACARDRLRRISCRACRRVAPAVDGARTSRAVSSLRHVTRTVRDCH